MSSPPVLTPQLSSQKTGRTGNHTRMQSEAWGSHSHSSNPCCSHKSALRRDGIEFLITGDSPFYSYVLSDLALDWR